MPKSIKSRLLGALTAMAGLMGIAYAQTQAPANVPTAWVQYAGLVEKSFEDRIGGVTDEAKRLRTYFGSASQSDSVALSVWVDSGGQVSRVDFAPLLNDQANTDLKDLLQGVKLASDPPPGILLPIHLRMHVASPAQSDR